MRETRCRRMVASKQRAEPVPPHPHGLVAQVDPALEQQVLDVPEAERVLNIHHHYPTDHLGRRVEVAERAGGFAGAGHGLSLASQYASRQSVHLL